jgi:hypothetical protein
MSQHTPRAEKRTVFYRSALPPWVALLIAAPLLLATLSVAALALAGGTAAALLLPLFGGRRPRGQAADDGCITLERDQYTRVERDRPPLPPG